MNGELHYNKYGIELIKVAPDHQCDEGVPFRQRIRFRQSVTFSQCSRKGTFRTTGKRPMYLCTQHANRYHWDTKAVKRKESP